LICELRFSIFDCRFPLTQVGRFNRKSQFENRKSAKGGEPYVA
jgi:hypothetical protein